MAYVLGYIVADGCVYKRKDRKNSYVLNITSKDRQHLLNIGLNIVANCSISTKRNSTGDQYCQIQVCSREICEDLMGIGIFPRKTHNLDSIEVPEKYFSDFARGFFDGDGTVYIYEVNNTQQIKAGFVSSSLPFITRFNQSLCHRLAIPTKFIHQTIDRKGVKIPKYDICFYVDDCEKLFRLMYRDNPKLFLFRKYEIFEKWNFVKRRHYKKQNYPSKIGWHLNKNKGAVSSVGRAHT